MKVWRLSRVALARRDRKPQLASRNSQAATRKNAARYVPCDREPQRQPEQRHRKGRPAKSGTGSRRH
eukprot:10462500-Alexandrium_andersonii.AAC.1